MVGSASWPRTCTVIGLQTETIDQHKYHDSDSATIVITAGNVSWWEIIVHYLMLTVLLSYGRQVRAMAVKAEAVEILYTFSQIRGLVMSVML